MSLHMVGARLREARERAGRSQEQIADATKVKLERIEALEENAFDRLPSGIYLHGIIRSYAHEIGVDAEELIQQLRTTAENPPPTDELAQLALLTEKRRRPETSRITMGLLVAAVLSVFALGGYLYTASQRDKSAAPKQGTIRAPAPVSTPEPPQATRSETPTPVATPMPPPPAAAEQVTRAAEPPPRRAAGTTGVVKRSARASPASDPEAASDITGVWRMSTEVASSSVSTLNGVRLGFLLNLRQDGDRIVGSGRKIVENDTALPAKAQTRITVEGRRHGDLLTLTFRERGSRRDSTGRFLLTRASEDELRGTFSSNAARSAGPVSAWRQ